MNNTLKALLELAAITLDRPINEDVSVEEQFPELVAPLMRYEMLFKQKIEDAIKEHVNVSKSDLILCKEVYGKSYFMNLQLPYDGIQRLCQELVAKCVSYKIKPSPIWQTYADGVFDWETDIDFMASL